MNMYVIEGYIHSDKPGHEITKKIQEFLTKEKINHDIDIELRTRVKKRGN